MCTRLCPTAAGEDPEADGNQGAEGAAEEPHEVHSQRRSRHIHGAQGWQRPHPAAPSPKSTRPQPQLFAPDFRARRPCANTTALSGVTLARLLRVVAVSGAGGNDRVSGARVQAATAGGGARRTAAIRATGGGASVLAPASIRALCPSSPECAVPGACTLMPAFCVCMHRCTRTRLQTRLPSMSSASTPTWWAPPRTKHSTVACHELQFLLRREQLCSCTAQIVTAAATRSTFS